MQKQADFRNHMSSVSGVHTLVCLCLRLLVSGTLVVSCLQLLVLGPADATHHHMRAQLPAHTP